MKNRISRRHFLNHVALLAGVGSTIGFKGFAQEKKVIPWYEEPMLNLHAVSKSPVKIDSIQLLKNGNYYFVRTISADGAVGVVRTKQIEHYVPIFEDLVAPVFLKEDARDLEALIDKVYIANYKLAGQSLWCPVAYIEQSLFDLLGRVAQKPVADLLGGRFRTEIPVYLSGSGRQTTAEEEVDIYVRGVGETGAEAVKFKIGGRMSRNLDAYPGRTETMLKLARKRLGDDIIIYADANGSYNSEKAIEVGRFLEELDIGFFEEPCPWQEYLETKRVTDALTLPVACGEQDSSLWGFEWMIDNRVMDIVQPDLNYHGGFIRGLRVANMALKRHMTIVPHNTQTGPSSVNILHFASAVRNTGPYMEYPWREPIEEESWYSPQFPIRNGKIKVPEGPGLGLEIDPEFLSAAEVIVTVT